MSNTKTLKHPDLANFNGEDSEKFVKRQQDLGNDVRWDGWDMVFFNEDSRGATSKDGAFRNGVWGFDNRFAVDAAGEYHVDYRNIKKVPREERNKWHR